MAGIHADGSVETLDLLQPGIPKLRLENEVHSIKTVEELVTIYLHVLEMEGPPDEVERVLDGVARLCTQRPEGFDRLVSPLVKRSRQLIKRPWQRTPAPLLAGVALAWLAQTRWTISTDGTCALAFLTKRLKALADRVLAGVSQPLMSAPTHAGGWIAHSAFCERSHLSGVTDEFDRKLGELRCFGTTTAAPPWLLVGLGDASSIRWAATLAPNHRDVWFGAGAEIIGHDLDWWDHWEAKAYLESLFEPDTPLGNSGLYLIVLGLASKENGEATLATDALIAGIEDGRIEPADLGEALTRIATRPGIKLPRICRRLRQASQVSKLHASTVHLAVRRLIESANPKPLRELIDDLTVECAGCDLTREQLRIRLDRAERWASSETVRPGHFSFMTPTT